MNVAASGEASKVTTRSAVPTARSPRSVGPITSTSSRARAASSAAGSGAAGSFPPDEEASAPTAAVDAGGDRRPLDRRHHRLVEPARALDDLGRRVAADDDPVVLHDRDRGRRPARALDVSPARRDDRPREGEARVGVGHPDRPVAEQLRCKGSAVAVAGDGVDADGVRVQDEALGQEGVEEQLDGGPPPAGIGEAGRQRRPHDRIALVGRVGGPGRLAGHPVAPVVGVEQCQQRLQVERHEILGARASRGTPRSA